MALDVRSNVLDVRTCWMKQIYMRFVKEAWQKNRVVLIRQVVTMYLRAGRLECHVGFRNFTCNLLLIASLTLPLTSTRPRVGVSLACTLSEITTSIFLVHIQVTSLVMTQTGLDNKMVGNHHDISGFR